MSKPGDCAAHSPILISSNGAIPRNNTPNVSYPRDHVLTDVPYRLSLVSDEFTAKKYRTLLNAGCIFCFVDYEKGASGEPVPRYYPIRDGVITRVDVIAQKLLLDVRLGNFAFYSVERLNAYYNESAKHQRATAAAWIGDLKLQPDIVHPIPKDKKVGMSFELGGTWKSGGFFVVRAKYDLVISPLERVREIRDQQEDWQSVVDRVSKAEFLKERVFYQIRLLQAPALSVPLQRSRSFRESIYDVNVNARTDVVLHFFAQPTLKEPIVVKVAISNEAVVIVGKNELPIYHDSSSGQLERIQLIAKRQLSAQFVQVRIFTDSTLGNAEQRLVTTELYLRIKPRKIFIGLILSLFFVGTFLNAIAEHESPAQFLPSWSIKVVGTALTVIAFWLTFSKFPSKGD